MVLFSLFVLLQTPYFALTERLFPDVRLVRYEELPIPEKDAHHALIGSLDIPKSLNEVIKTIATKNVRTLDLDADGTPDVIYSGESKSEENVTLFWRRTKNGFFFSGFLWGKVCAVSSPNKGSPAEFILVSDFCCASWVGTMARYRFNTIANRCDTIQRVKFCDEAESLKGKTIAPKRFKITQEKYRLRRSPEVVDSLDTLASEQDGKAVYGNILAEFPSSVTGTAFAEYQDKTGRVWWLVMIDRNAPILTSRFYDDANAYRLGWMSSRFLEPLP
jgi:hypothetical protein